MLHACVPLSTFCPLCTLEKREQKSAKLAQHSTCTFPRLRESDYLNKQLHTLTLSSYYCYYKTLHLHFLDLTRSQRPRPCQRPRITTRAEAYLASTQQMLRTRHNQQVHSSRFLVAQSSAPIETAQLMM